MSITITATFVILANQPSWPSVPYGNVLSLPTTFYDTESQLVAESKGPDIITWLEILWSNGKRSKCIFTRCTISIIFIFTAGNGWCARKNTCSQWSIVKCLKNKILSIVFEMSSWYEKTQINLFTYLTFPSVVCNQYTVLC